MSAGTINIIKAANGKTAIVSIQGNLNVRGFATVSDVLNTRLLDVRERTQLGLSYADQNMDFTALIVRGLSRVNRLEVRGNAVVGSNFRGKKLVVSTGW